MRSFAVLGETVEVLVDGDQTGGLSTTLTQTSPPGGGPPPHSHRYEDETFFVLEGEYDFLHEGQWIRRNAGGTWHAGRGTVHTFRNAGKTVGKMLVFAAPSGMDKYLEEISPLQMPEDGARMAAISEKYGIAFAGPNAG